MNIVLKTALVEHQQPAQGNAKSSGVCRILASALIASTMLLGGCASYQRDQMIVGSTPSDYRTAHPIIVSENDVVEDIAISANSKSMSLRDENVVRDFASRFRRSGAKSMKIVVPSGSRNEMAARRAARQAKRLLQKGGVRASSIHTIAYQAADHGDAATLRLVYTALTADVPTECGKWEEDLTFTPENRNYGNFGCATQNNMAKMIANPADLIGPSGTSEIDAERRDNVISDWRNDGSSMN